VERSRTKNRLNIKTNQVFRSKTGGHRQQSVLRPSGVVPWGAWLVIEQRVGAEPKSSSTRTKTAKRVEDGREQAPLAAVLGQDLTAGSADAVIAAFAASDFHAPRGDPVCALHAGQQTIEWSFLKGKHSLGTRPELVTEPVSIKFAALFHYGQDDPGRCSLPYLGHQVIIDGLLAAKGRARRPNTWRGTRGTGSWLVGRRMMHTFDGYHTTGGGGKSKWAWRSRNSDGGHGGGAGPGGRRGGGRRARRAGRKRLRGSADCGDTCL